MHTWPDLNVVGEYWLDACSVPSFFFDTLRQRGNIYNEHNAKEIPHVLHFESELVLDGRTFGTAGKLRSGADCAAKRNTGRSVEDSNHRD